MDTSVSKKLFSVRVKLSAHGTLHYLGPVVRFVSLEVFQPGLEHGRQAAHLLERDLGPHDTVGCKCEERRDGWPAAGVERAQQWFPIVRLAAAEQVESTFSALRNRSRLGFPVSVSASCGHAQARAHQRC